MATTASDAVIVGGGHNALVASILLARAGRSVLLLERNGCVGGAAVSSAPFSGVDVSLSRYAYLVSLFPAELLRSLGVAVELRRRRISSCTPDGTEALVVGGSDGETQRSFARLTGSSAEHANWLAWHRLTGQMAAVLAPSLTRPLRPAAELRAKVGAEAWSLVVEQPLGASLAQAFASDLVRGLVLTDGVIGTFAASEEASLRQNRCLLYHVIGNGHGRWDVPVGGMGAITASLHEAATAAGVEVRTAVEACSIDADGRSAEVRSSSGERHRAGVVLCGAAPAVLDRLLDRPARLPQPEGSQLKLNVVLRRLPRLACGVDPRDAFTGTLHVNERASQLDGAHEQAAAGDMPTPMPCELYCHSLTDPSIVGAELRRAGVHTLTAFALHTPARLFRDDPQGAAGRARQALLASLQSVLDEPLEDCILRAGDGSPCIELHTPLDVERELAMPGGHIFHGDLQWPWAESDEQVGTWGVETDIANVFVCGSGARRGGGVSGIAGHNAAMAALARLAATD